MTKKNVLDNLLAIYKNASSELLAAVSTLAFYKNRFEGPTNVLGGPQAFITNILVVVPADLANQSLWDHLKARLVNEFSECPPPADFRRFIALEAVLKLSGLNDLGQTFERTKHLKVTGFSNEFTDRVFYSTAKALGSSFNEVRIDGWGDAIVNTLLNHEVIKEVPPVVTVQKSEIIQRDFKSLLKNDNAE